MPKPVRTKLLTRIGFFISVSCACFILCLLLAVDVHAAASSRKITMRVGQSVKLQLNGATQSVIWTASSSAAKRIKLNQRGKVTAKKIGKAVVKVNYDGKTYSFPINVKAKKKGQRQTIRTISLTITPSTRLTASAIPAIPVESSAADDNSGLVSEATGEGTALFSTPTRADLVTTIGKKVAESKIIMVGDSRFEGMHNACGGSASWITAVGEGISWLNNSVIPSLYNRDVKGYSIVFNLGINDLGSTNSYITSLNKCGKKLRKRGAQVFFMTVNPVDEALEEAYGYSCRNSDIVALNCAIARSLCGFGIIDTYDYMVDNGFTATDGVHYSSDTYRMIYSYLCDCVRK